MTQQNQQEDRPLTKEEREDRSEERAESFAALQHSEDMLYKLLPCITGAALGSAAFTTLPNFACKPLLGVAWVCMGLSLLFFVRMVLISIIETQRQEESLAQYRYGYYKADNGKIAGQLKMAVRFLYVGLFFFTLAVVYPCLPWAKCWEAICQLYQQVITNHK